MTKLDFMQQYALNVVRGTGLRDPGSVAKFALCTWEAIERLSVERLPGETTQEFERRRSGDQ